MSAFSKASMRDQSEIVNGARPDGAQGEEEMRCERKCLNSTFGPYSYTIGIRSINVDVSGIKFENVANAFGLRREKLRRENGPVDALLGIDQPKLPTGETRESGNLVSRYSPLGWVIFGAMSEKCDNVNHVFLVRCTNLVDMTDFWTTESMGVEGKMCSWQSKTLSPIEAYEAKIIEDFCQKIANRWLILYTWAKDAAEIPDKRSQAEKKLEAAVR